MTGLFSNRELKRRLVTVCLVFAVILCIGVPFVIIPLVVVCGVLWAPSPADFDSISLDWAVLIPTMLKLVLGPLALFWPLVFRHPLA
jgi:hypothetical protein